MPYDERNKYWIKKAYCASLVLKCAACPAVDCFWKFQKMRKMKEEWINAVWC
jgi:hypothetical protein